MCLLRVYSYVIARTINMVSTKTSQESEESQALEMVGQGVEVRTKEIRHLCIPGC